MSVLLGAIADDCTGAADLANTLVGQEAPVHGLKPFGFDQGRRLVNVDRIRRNKQFIP